MSRTEQRFRYPGSASCTSLIQLSTPESVVSLLTFRRTQLFCVLSIVLLGCCGVCPNIHLSIFRGFIDRQFSAELRKPGQGFAWGQQWSPSASPAQGVSDFGLSALFDTKRQDGLLHTTCGTPAHVAPESVLQDTEQSSSTIMKPTCLNAFDIISLSPGFDLSSLFEKDKSHRLDVRFTTQKSASTIVSRLEEVASMGSFKVKKKNGTVKMKGNKEGRKGQLAIDAEIFEITPAFHVVHVDTQF
ncbi:hypothetical protein KY290_016464 [Solanum tuberosum]|uniref:non-specific serine/threonine protein kinase n=1 Tax=Solanum tuberosum TaxID=4113 RepID=A0ABQ7V8K2_SOLTU|nr:hypothetical protein KY290_016464 [Solanum tuberosum]